jgi:ABC-type glycerol-3-phosphate transport system substrate-binding protein
MRYLTLALASILLAGCGLLGNPFGLSPTDAPPTPTESAPTLTAPTAGPAETLAPEEVPINPDEVVITVWMAEPLTTGSEAPGGEALSEQLASFDESHPDIRVDVYVKATNGPGSTLAYLRSAPSVAPGVVPDLALMDRETLVQAARETLVVPIGTLADPATLTDLYPVATELGSIDGDLIGMPYMLQTQHVVYRETLFEGPPSSLEAVLASPVPYIFPAGTLGNVNRTLLQQYLAAGGTLTAEDGSPTLDSAALTQLLEFYAQAREDNIIDPSLFQITSPDESWAQYDARQAGLATVTSTTYLAHRSEVRSTGVTWTPTLDGEPYALVSGWIWVVTTSNEERQAAAMSLLNFLMNPVNQGTYAQAADWLPSQSSALAVWGDDDTYAAFADQLLQAADPLPDQSVRSNTGAALQAALEDVLLNNVAPVQAANQAAQTVRPTGDTGG